MRLTLVRHGESIWNSIGRWQGQNDVPLSPRGRVQARALASRLFGQRFDRMLSSDLSRALETASAIGRKPECDERLREIDVGAWSGLLRDEVAERFPDELEQLRAGLPVKIGGGESMPEFERRVDAVLDELCAAGPGERILAVTHGGVIRAIATRILGLRGQLRSPLVGVSNASLSVVAADPLALLVFNDAAHLDASDPELVLAPEHSARLALIAADPSAPPDRALADRLLSGLGIARIAAIGTASLALAQHLTAEPWSDAEAELSALRTEQGELALVLPPDEVRTMCAELLGLRAANGLGLPSHGSVAQLRLSARAAVLHSYGVSL